MLHNLFWQNPARPEVVAAGLVRRTGGAFHCTSLYVYPFINRAASMMKLLDSLPPVIKNLIGKNNFMATPEGFFNLQPFSILAPLLFIVSPWPGAATPRPEKRSAAPLICCWPIRCPAWAGDAGKVPGPWHRPCSCCRSFSGWAWPGSPAFGITLNPAAWPR